ncbi:rod shape-determining protein [Croceicoccus pelagius]|uniref:Rod shape-determining protein n=2 Tax=Croceicoccus pelagius TaxID=1703341 RepID=A0A916YMZ8_9SPHN|nr:rod shape-determining protein [Croceicoccus pelagius]
MNFLSIGSRRGPDLAIDLGTANMRVMVRGEGVVFDEPSLCYYEKKSGQMKLIAAGLDVLAMVDRVPGTHLVRRPLARGVLQDMDAATALLAHGLTSVIGKKPSGRPPAMISIPADATKAEANALLTAANDAGFGRIELVREPFAAAIGAELPVRESRASMVIECGAGTTEVAVFSINGQCRSRSVRLGGLDLDEAITEHLHLRHHFLIGKITAEALKKHLAEHGPGNAEVQIKGRSLHTGLPGTLTLPVSEFHSVLKRHFGRFADAARLVVSEISPDLAADLLNERVVATGGGICARFLAEAIAAECGIPVTIANDPHGCVSRGLMRLMEERAA